MEVICFTASSCRKLLFSNPARQKLGNHCKRKPVYICATPFPWQAKALQSRGSEASRTLLMEPSTVHLHAYVYILLRARVDGDLPYIVVQIHITEYKDVLCNIFFPVNSTKSRSLSTVEEQLRNQGTALNRYRKFFLLSAASFSRTWPPVTSPYCPEYMAVTPRWCPLRERTQFRPYHT